MATKKKKKNGINAASLIITLTAVILAVVAIIFLIKTTGSDEETETTPAESNSTEFQATQELVDATQQAAYDLLPKNYKVFQYLTRGMTHEDEPYGNLPEDGFYTCVSDEFNNFEDFSNYIEEIYTERRPKNCLPIHSETVPFTALTIRALWVFPQNSYRARKKVFPGRTYTSSAPLFPKPSAMSKSL